MPSTWVERFLVKEYLVNSGVDPDEAHSAHGLGDTLDGLPDIDTASGATVRALSQVLVALSANVSLPSRRP